MEQTKEFNAMFTFIGKLIVSVILVVCCFLSPWTAALSINTISQMWE